MVSGVHWGKWGKGGNRGRQFEVDEEIEVDEVDEDIEVDKVVVRDLDRCK